MDSDRAERDAGGDKGEDGFSLSWGKVHEGGEIFFEAMTAGHLRTRVKGRGMEVVMELQGVEGGKEEERNGGKYGLLG